MHPNVPSVIRSTNYRERFEASDETVTVVVFGGDLQVCIVGPNGTAYVSEVIPAPVAPLTCTARVINSKGLELEFRPQASAQFWLDR